METPNLPDIKIRRATDSDAGFIAQNVVNLEKETNYLDVDYNIVLEYVRRRLSHPNSMAYWIATVNGNDAGSMSLQYEPKFARNNYYLQLQVVYIREPYRGIKVFQNYTQFMLD
jgi:hypothetical protein